MVTQMRTKLRWLRALCHPVVVLMLPTALATMLGSVIAMVVTPQQDDWEGVTAGMIWLSLFSGGLAGFTFNALSAWRLRTSTVSDVTPVLTLGMEEAALVRAWLVSGTAVVAAAKELSKKAKWTQ